MADAETKDEHSFKDLSSNIMEREQQYHSTYSPYAVSVIIITSLTLHTSIATIKPILMYLLLVMSMTVLQFDMFYFNTSMKAKKGAIS